MHWIEAKYIGLVSNRLRNYKRKSSTLYCFSCPFCGDSESDRKKARGYVYTKKGNTFFHCHNCGLTHNFSTFLKNLDFQLYSEFNIERLKDEKPKEQIEL
jgi:transcription elongation factor Elf1